MLDSSARYVVAIRSLHRLDLGNTFVEAGDMMGSPPEPLGFLDVSRGLFIAGDAIGSGQAWVIQTMLSLDALLRVLAIMNFIAARLDLISPEHDAVGMRFGIEYIRKLRDLVETLVTDGTSVITDVRPGNRIRMRTSVTCSTRPVCIWATSRHHAHCPIGRNDETVSDQQVFLQDVRRVSVVLRVSYHVWSLTHSQQIADSTRNTMTLFVI